MSRWPAASSAARMTPTWPSIIPLGPSRCAPASAWATAISRVDGERGVVVDPAVVAEHAAVAVVGELVEAGVGHDDGRVADLGRTSRRATLSTPSGSTPAVPVASRRAGTPKSMSPPTPAVTASTAALRRESRVCCTTPGIDAIGVGSVAPSFTNIGSTSWRGRRVVSATSRRSAGVARSRRGRWVGKAITPAYEGTKSFFRSGRSSRRPADGSGRSSMSASRLVPARLTVESAADLQELVVDRTESLLHLRNPRPYRCAGR